MLVADPYEPQPPFTFVGTETVLVVIDKTDEPRTQEVERWLDDNGRSCSVLDLYRAVQHPAGEGDYETSDRIQAQIDAERARWAQTKR